MAITLSSETTINASPDAVFSYVSDLEKHPEWGQHDNSVTKRGDGAVGVGTVDDTVGHQFGTQKEAVTVTEYSPGKRFGYESQGSIGTVSHAFDLSPAGDGTRLVKSFNILKPSFMTRLLTPMIKRKAGPGLSEDLRRIKARLEA